MEPKPTFSRQIAADLIRDPETLGTVILIILLSKYGEEIFDMDPVELYVRIQEDFHSTLTEEGENRLNAILMAVTSDAFYEDPLAFRAIASALYDGDLGDMVNGVLDDLTIPEILWAIYEVGLLRDETEEDDFSPAVQRVIDEEMMNEAEEQDMEDPEQVIPYYERFVESMKGQLHEQLGKLGLVESDIDNLL